MDVPPANSSSLLRPKRRWWQFSLKSLIFMSEQTGGEAARALIRHGARIDARNARGTTARGLAEAIDHTQVLEVLDEAQP